MISSKNLTGIIVYPNFKGRDPDTCSAEVKGSKIISTLNTAWREAFKQARISYDKD